MRGHHVYKFVWTPVIGEELYLEPKESSEHDEYAVVVRKAGEIVGHVPHSFSCILWYLALNQTPGIYFLCHALPPVLICDQAFI